MNRTSIWQRLTAALQHHKDQESQDQQDAAENNTTASDKPQKRSRRGVHYVIVIALLSLFFCSFSNVALWRHVYQIISESENLPALFVITVPIAIYLLLNAIFLILFSWRYVLKPVFVVLLLTGAMATYAAWSYGIIFDSGMITNVVETNVAEATSYFSLTSVVTFICLGVIPALLLIKTRIYYPRLVVSQLQRIGAIAASLVLAVALIIPYYQQYSFVGRNNHSLSKEILPTSYVWYTYRHIKDKYFTTPKEYVTLGADAQMASTTDKPKLIFLVIGETARAQNFSQIGYQRPTNRFTDMEPMFTYNISSCGTYTAYSLPCMFSNLRRSGYDPSEHAVGEYRDGVLQVLQKSGVKVAWVENDGGCKGVCKDVQTIEINPKQEDKKYCNGDTCFDEVMLSYADKLSENVTEDTVIAFHIIGSHGPRYYERYPERFRKYTPDCNRPDVENCSVEEIVNAYDNTIAYTDYVIYQLIEILEKRFDTNDPALIYLSDHGESLGENNVYLHAAPYAIAPDYQTRVPMQIWFPSPTADDMSVNLSCLQGLTKVESLSHDNLFHTLMGMMQVKSSEYEARFDLLAQCPLPQGSINQVIPHPEENPLLEP